LAEIDDALATFLHGAGALIIGTRDASRAPEITRGWGLRVLDSRTVEMCVGLPSSRRTLANLEANGRLAATFVAPIEYRQVQLKGRLVEVLEPTADDRAWVERAQQGFLRRVEPLGIAPDLCPRFWSYDDGLVKLRVAVEEAYDQTPGPSAGRPL
jgi:hypothetical protein